MTRFYIYIVLFCLSIAYASAQLNKKTQKDFNSLQVFSEKGDYKAGLFYTKKTEKSITKKTGSNSIESLLLLCYKAHFSNQVTNKQDSTFLPEIDKRLTEVSNDSNVSALFEVYKQYSTLYYTNGIYSKSDALYKLLNSKREQLLPFEREQLEYYKLYADYKKGYLNEVSALCAKHIDYLLTRATTDSVIKKNSIIVKKLSSDERKNRYLWAERFLGLQVRAQMDNGLIDSAFAQIAKYEKDFSKNLSSKKGCLSEIYYLKGLCFLKQDEFKKAEKELHSALAIAKGFYLENASVITDINHALITAQLAEGKNEEAEFYNNDVSVKVVGYYGTRSLAYQHNNYTDIELHLIQHQWEIAGPEITKFLSSSFLPAIHEYRSNALSDLYQVYIKTHEYAKADSIIGLLLTQQIQLYGESPALNKTKLKQAFLYSNYFDRFKEAKTILTGIADDSYLKHISVANPEYIKTVTAEARLYEYLEDYKSAFEVLSTGLNLIKTSFGETSEEYAKLLNPSAALKINSGNYSEAGKEIDQSLAIFKSKDSKSSIRYIAEALEIKARLKIIEGDYKQADSLLKEATAAYSKISRLSTDDLFSIEEIGLLYINTGKYSKAEKYLKKILIEREAGLGKDHKSTYTILNYLGELNVVTGNYSDADRYFERSTGITKKIFGDKSIPYANSLVYQKKLYTVLGDVEKSTKILKTAIDIYKKAYGDDNVKVGILMHEYALAAMELSIQQGTGKKAKAELETIINKSLQIIKDKLSDASPAYANALEDAALFYVYSNDTKKALYYLSQAQTIWSNKLGDKNVYSARLKMLEGKIYYKMESYSEALVAFEKSKSVYENLFDNHHPLYIEALGKCAQLYYILGQKNKAIESIEYCVEKSNVYLKNVFPLLSEKGKSAYWEKVKEDFEFYKTLTFTSEKVSDDMVAKVFNMQLQTRAILLGSQLKIKQKVISSGDTLLIRLYNEITLNRENLARAYSMTIADRKDDGYDINAMEASTEKLEKQLSEKSELFAGTDDKVIVYDWKNLKALLKNDELVLEVVPFRLFTKKFTDTIWYAVISVDDKSKTPSYVLIKNGKELQEKYLTYYRNCVKFDIVDNNSYDNYWKPVLPLIKPTHKNIYFVRDGVYNQINPETIKDPQGNYLLNAYKIHNLCTSRDLFARNSSKKKSNDKNTPEISLFGNPIYYSPTFTYKRSMPQLPGSEIEVKKIDSVMVLNKWKTFIYVEGNATEEQIKAVNNPKVLHISTHGFYADEKKRTGEDLREMAADNPLLRSGLLMKEGGDLVTNADFNTINKTDGVLTAYEVLNMSLDKTDLVILSACETGLGDVKIGEGVLGLQRSFQVAGAQTVVMSIFKVSDEVTQKLMLQFYKNWLVSGNKFESFVQAKKEIMVRYHEPKYWGAFVMIGVE